MKNCILFLTLLALCGCAKKPDALYPPQNRIIGEKELPTVDQKKPDVLFPPRVRIVGEHERPTSDQKKWALSTCSIVIELNNGRHDLLGGVAPDGAGRRRCRDLLSRFWDIYSERDVDRVLGRLLRDGDNREFREIHRRLGQMSTTERLQWLKEHGWDGRYRIVSYYVLNPNANILAWDYGRYIAVCGWSYAAGYLSEQEAWDLIMPVARALQLTCRNWDNLQRDYLIGCEFWSINSTPLVQIDVKNGAYDIAAGALLSLVRNPETIWKKLKWDLDLTAATVPGAR